VRIAEIGDGANGCAGAAALNTSAWSETEMMNIGPRRIAWSERPTPEVEVEWGTRRSNCGDHFMHEYFESERDARCGLLAKKAGERACKFAPASSARWRPVRAWSLNI